MTDAWQLLLEILASSWRCRNDATPATISRGSAATRVSSLGVVHYRSLSPWLSTVFGGDKTIGEPVTSVYVCVQ
jgi:hypothetical protein